MSSVAQGRLCILSKLVHASERTWCRLVIPGAVLKLWQAMQREIKAVGSDFTIIVQSPDGKRAWRFGARMTVQRPMLLEMGPFYADNAVQEGDSIHLYRDLLTNAIYVDVERGPASQAAAASAAMAAALQNTAVPEAPAPAAAPELLPSVTIDPYVAAAVAAAAASALPCQIWTQHMGKATAQRREAAGGGAAPKKRSPAHSEDDSDGDWSPTARGGSRSRGAPAGAGAAGPLPLRRKLADGQQTSSRQSNSDEDSADVYGAEQMRRFDALVDVAASLSQSPSPATSGQS